jgi:gliding motility-associated-like protein
MHLSFYIKLLFLLFILFVIDSTAQASHIRAGEITAVRVNNKTYTFTLTVYGNRYSPVRSDVVEIDFGDLTSQNVSYNAPEVNVSATTYIRTYTCQKTFSGDGTYRVSYRESFRNADIKNIANSAGTDFFVETYISVSSSIGVNNPLQLAIPPIDQAAVGKLFIHNPGAYDPDGDSLSYKLIIPRQAPVTNVNGYFTPPFSHSFSLNPITGDLTWDSPTQTGLFNVAFIIEEWRKGANGSYSRISYVVRDMQINVINSVNNPPVVIIPADTCVKAGTLLTKTIKATDPDGNQIYLTATPSTYFTVPAGPQNTPVSGTFSWQTQCTDVRDQPYFFVFKAEDKVSRDTMTDYKTWQIKVKGPAPTGLIATSAGNSITLNWNAYPCSNAQKMEIYRLSCDSSSYHQTPCQSSITGFPGYVKIGEVPIGTTSFLDNNQGKGLTRGTNYCYIIVAKFPLPKGGESYASAQSCEGLKLDAPIITNVSVSTTSSGTGTIFVHWLAPTQAALPGPYTYNVYRANGLRGTAFVAVATGLTGTSFADAGLNTLTNSYVYKIELAGGGSSDPASTLFLSNTPSNKALTLNWDSNVPWREDSVYIYRNLNGAGYVHLATLAGNPKTYFDNSGLANCDTACYYLTLFSSYCDPTIPSMEYVDSSEINCGTPIDTRPPVAPDLTVKGCEGDLSVFTDLLHWNNVSDPQCNTIKNYNIYFSDYENTDIQLTATTDYTVTDYIYTNFQSTAGCFVVSAVNLVGVEGEKSQKICVDDCVYYDLPNLVTPNGDSLNDNFRPFPIPRGVSMVNFKVYNRWGALVFSTNKDIHINWNSVSNDGQTVSDGVYYFIAEVKYFRRKNKIDEYKILKGWVQVLDNREVKTHD